MLCVNVIGVIFVLKHEYNFFFKGTYLIRCFPGLLRTFFAERLSKMVKLYFIEKFPGVYVPLSNCIEDTLVSVKWCHVP